MYRCRLCRSCTPSLIVHVWVLTALGVWGWGGSTTNSPGGGQAQYKEHPRKELASFPYMGLGDAAYSFSHPIGGYDSVADGWQTLGAVVLTQVHGVDVLRLTNAEQELQSSVFAIHPTASEDFNGYFDITLGTAKGSHYPADGMGFFFSEHLPHTGSAMGMTDLFKGLGIIIDTYSNSRRQAVPYMYAYVSDGQKKWNPDSDGKDMELTEGCKLSMDQPTRVYVQFVDRNLRVAVATNENHQQWHTCFTYNNVPLPFTGSGYLSFAAETGHFYAVHDLRDVSFVVGEGPHSNSNPADVHGQGADAGGSSGYVSGGAHADGFADGQNPGSPASSVGAGKSEKSDVLQSHVDEHVKGLYTEFSSVLKLSSASDRSVDTAHGLEAVRQTLEAVTSMVQYMFLEIERQVTETQDASIAVRKLQHAAQEIHDFASRLSTEVGTLHDRVHEYRHSLKELQGSHEKTHDLLIEHSAMTHGFLETVSEASPHGFLSISVFLVLQAVFVAGFVVLSRVGAATSSKRQHFM